MGINWSSVLTCHSDLFIAKNFEKCSEDKRKAWRLSTKFEYFIGGETSLRVGIVACSEQSKEEEFLLSGIILGQRLSNGAKTIIYFIAPDFSPFFINSLSKIDGYLTLRAMYWREKLTPSLYLIPEKNKSFTTSSSGIRYSIGMERPDWDKWGQGLNPVAKQQLKVVQKFFEELRSQNLTIEKKVQNILVKWGDYEIAEVRKKGKKIELSTKTKWGKNLEQIRNWQKSGWVDASGNLNQEFRKAINEIIQFLHDKEANGEISSKELLDLWLSRGGGIISTLWGEKWEWPWLQKDRQENWVGELEYWYFYKANGQLSIVCPIIDRPLNQVVNCLILSSVLESSNLLQVDTSLNWDGRVHLLTFEGMEEELRCLHSWLKKPELFPVWVLPIGWENNGLSELRCKTPVPDSHKNIYDNDLSVHNDYE